MWRYMAFPERCNRQTHLKSLSKAPLARVCKRRRITRDRHLHTTGGASPFSVELVLCRNQPDTLRPEPSVTRFPAPRLGVKSRFAFVENRRRFYVRLRSTSPRCWLRLFFAFRKGQGPGGDMLCGNRLRLWHRAGMRHIVPSTSVSRDDPFRGGLTFLPCEKNRAHPEWGPSRIAAAAWTTSRIRRGWKKLIISGNLLPKTPTKAPQI
jgi:hypothetical protein